MKAGTYFHKPRLLSDKIQSLLDQIQAAEPISGASGLPSTLFTPQCQQYQEYYASVCSAKYYETFYKHTCSTNVASKIPPKVEKTNKVQSPTKINKKQKKQKKKAQQTTAQNDIPAIARCVFLVGKIIEISDHSNADSMLVEMIDVGKDKPRQICSGIKGKVSKEEMRNSLVVVFSNLKKARLRGIESNGMILAASNSDKSKLEIVRPPKGSQIGERVVLEDEDLTQYNVTTVVKLKKKDNPWFAIKDDLKTDQDAFACYNGRKLVTSAGPLAVTSLTDARIS